MCFISFTLKETILHNVTVTMVNVIIYLKEIGVNIK